MERRLKFPRVVVSAKRHAKLSAEANKRHTTIEYVAEEQFRKAETK